jgi:aerobic-type carbon monoxide dehydrogenase small subunit (CoxS/CutS family)
MKEAEFRLTVNGAESRVTCEPDTPLLDVLRHDLGLAGPRFGCGTGLCGACFALIGDRTRSSCDLPVSAVNGCRAAMAGFTRSSRRSSMNRPPSAVIASPAW